MASDRQTFQENKVDRGSGEVWRAQYRGPDLIFGNSKSDCQSPSIHPYAGPDPEQLIMFDDICRYFLCKTSAQDSCRYESHSFDRILLSQ